MNVTLLCSLATIACATAAVAQAPLPPRSVEDLLPESTYAVMRFGGLDACQQAARQWPLTEMVQTFLSDVPAEVREEHLERQLDRIANRLRRGLQRANVRPADVRSLVGQPMALAIGRLSIEGMGPSVALLIEEGDHGDALRRCAAAALLQLDRMGVGQQQSDCDIGGTSWQRVDIEDGPPIFFGSVAGNFVISNSRGYLRELTAVANRQQPALMSDDHLAGLQQRLPAPALASWMINTRSLMSVLAPHMPYEAGDYSEALGIGQLDVIYGATTATGNAGCDFLHIGIGGSESGLMKALVAKPVDLSFARICSPNTVLFGAGSFDPSTALDAADRFLELLPAGAGDELRRELRRGLRDAGSSAMEVEGCLRAFGDQIAMAVSLGEGCGTQARAVASHRGKGRQRGDRVDAVPRSDGR